MGIKLRDHIDVNSLFTEEEIKDMFQRAGYQKKNHFTEIITVTLKSEKAYGRPDKSGFVISIKFGKSLYKKRNDNTLVVRSYQDQGTIISC